jgi:glycosyltransferase 2 family protein
LLSISRGRHNFQVRQTLERNTGRGYVWAPSLSGAGAVAPLNSVDDSMSPAVFARAFLIPAGKAAISAIAIVAIVSHTDFNLLLDHLHKLSIFTATVALVLLVIETALIAGLRLKLVLAAMGQNRRLDQTCRVALSGFFFEQVALGFVGGDAMRLWLLHQSDVPVRTALQAIVVDRCLGFVGLFLLAMVGLPGVVVLLTGYDWRLVVSTGAIAVAAIGVIAFAVLSIARKIRAPFVAEMVSLAATAVQKPDVRTRLLSAFALAVVAQSMNVFVFFLFGRDLGMSVGLAHWFLIVPPALLIALLPISAGGWGVREASFVVALAAFSVRPEEAIIPSILFGLGLLIVTLPGGIVWLANRKPRSTMPDGSPAPAENTSIADRHEDRLAVAAAPGAADERAG